MAASKSDTLTEIARKTAAELDTKAEQLADEAWKQAKQEQKRLEKEARKFAKDAETAARQKSVTLEKKARKKAAEMEKAAWKKANEVSAKMEKAARLKTTDLERSVTDLLSVVDKKLSALDTATGGKGNTRSFGFLSQSYNGPSTLREKLVEVALGIIVVMGSLTALTNIMGEPSMVIDHWENTGFGERFITLDMSVARKRIVAGE